MTRLARSFGKFNAIAGRMPKADSCDFCSWPIASLTALQPNVRFWVRSGSRVTASTPLAHRRRDERVRTSRRRPMYRQHLFNSWLGPWFDSD